MRNCAATGNSRLFPERHTCSPNRARWKRPPGWPRSGFSATWSTSRPEGRRGSKDAELPRCFSIGGPTMIPIKSILHPTDFSQPSEYALRFACALARDYKARLLLLHVVEPPVYYGELGMTVPLPADFHEGLQERLELLIPVDAGA